MADDRFGAIVCALFMMRESTFAESLTSKIVATKSSNEQRADGEMLDVVRLEIEHALRHPEIAFLVVCRIASLLERARTSSAAG